MTNLTRRAESSEAPAARPGALPAQSPAGTGTKPPAPRGTRRPARGRRRGLVLAVTVLAVAAAGHWAWPSTPLPTAVGAGLAEDPEVASFKSQLNRLHGKRARLEREFSTETAQRLYAELEQALAAQKLPGFRKSLAQELEEAKKQLEARAVAAWAEVRGQAESLQKAGNARAALAALGRFPTGLRSFDPDGHAPTQAGTECGRLAEALGATLREEDPERSAAKIEAALAGGEPDTALELTDQAVARAEGEGRKDLEATRLRVLSAMVRPAEGKRLTVERLGVLRNRLDALGRRYAGDDAVLRHLDRERRELEAGLAERQGSPGGPAGDLVAQVRPAFRRRDLVGVRRILRVRFDRAAKEGPSAGLLVDPKRQESLAQVLGDSPDDTTGSDLESVVDLAAEIVGRDDAFADAPACTVALALLEDVFARAERALLRSGEEPWFRIGLVHRVLSRPTEVRLAAPRTRTDEQRRGAMLDGEWLAVAPRGAATLTSEDVLRLARHLPSKFPADLEPCAVLALLACERRAPPAVRAAPLEGGHAMAWRACFGQVLSRIGRDE
ncbi:MAG: hypothetical protein HYZ53_12765 [Planctomycetes bacterium]|nr:hypothetical protein [Planctomycetota bacterium]